MTKFFDFWDTRLMKDFKNIQGHLKDYPHKMSMFEIQNIGL